MADPFFYIDYTNPKTGASDILALDSTTVVTRGLNNEIPQNIISTGASVVDHVVNKGDKITFAGIISDIKTSNPANELSTDEWIDNIEALRDSKEFFNVVVGDITTQNNIVEKCLFESLSIRQDTTRGISGGRVKAYRVSFNAKQVRLAEVGITGEINVPGKEIEDKSADKENKTSATVQTTFSGAAVIRNGQPVMIVPEA